MAIKLIQSYDIVSLETKINKFIKDKLAVFGNERKTESNFTVSINTTPQITGSAGFNSGFSIETKLLHLAVINYISGE